MEQTQELLKKFPVGLIIGGAVLVLLGIFGGMLAGKFIPVPEAQIDKKAVICGGWNTGGEIICDCSGELIKPDCPSGAMCDGGNYLCQGECGSCCWRGSGNVQYGGPYPKCGAVRSLDRVCELGKEYESNAAEGPDCQCPEGFQPEIVDMSMGPCPGDGRITDCPSSRFKCSKEKVNSGTEGKFCGGIAGNLPENQCPTGFRCRLDGNYPDAGGKCVRE